MQVVTKYIESETFQLETGLTLVYGEPEMYVHPAVYRMLEKLLDRPAYYKRLLKRKKRR